MNYFSDEEDGPVAGLIEKLAAGAVTFKHQGPQGYLRSLLAALDVPLESQVLVFSKSSLNTRLIEPKNPRAIYFNDEVYVGWTPGSPALEISTVSPRKGTLFFTLPQAADKAPRFGHDGRCIVCHASTTSLGVPGHLVRSFETKADGTLVSGYSRVTHDTPFRKRWGGWYVTGRHGKLPHHGNLVCEEDHVRRRGEPAFRADLTDLSPFFDVSKYPTPHSDLVALLLLDHQAHLHNLFTRLNLETQLGMDKDSQALEQLVRYLFLADAPTLPSAVEGTSGYAAWYQRQGPRDRRGRSLRELDLKTRLFRYPMSPLIYSSSATGLPVKAKSRLYRRLWEILSGKDESPVFRDINQNQRRAVLEILRETKKDLPDYWSGK